jgi:hypothetical protein
MSTATITDQVRQIPEDYREMFIEAVIEKMCEYGGWAIEGLVDLRMAEEIFVAEERPDDSDEVKAHREKVVGDRSRQAVVLEEKRKILACMARLYLELVPADSDEGFGAAAEKMARDVVPQIAEELDYTPLGAETVKAVECLNGALEWSTRTAAENSGFKPVVGEEAAA